MELKDKTVLVTGGAQRLGRAIALGFAERGAHIIVHYRRSETEAAAVMEEIRALGVKASSCCADLTRFSELEQMSAQLLNEHKTIDILVNNASIFLSTPLTETTEAQWDDFVAIHMKAPYFLAQRLAPAMKKQGSGRIINMADWRGLHPNAGFVPYAVSKAGLLALTEGLAKELAPEVLVNAVCPGPILLPKGADESVREKLIASTLLKRMGTPADIVRQVLFLAEQDYATGYPFFVDGGQSLD